jgi:hypothetical protein
MTLLGLKYILKAGHKSYMEFARSKIFCFWSINISHPVIRKPKKEGFPRAL